MRGIGGNVTAEIQISTTTENEIGEKVHTWTTVKSIKGWLDFISGEARRTEYNAKIEESTHVFIADYVALPDTVFTESARIIIKGMRYDVVLIDNPMEMGSGSQLEIYLKFTGGQNG